MGRLLFTLPGPPEIWWILRVVAGSTSPPHCLSASLSQPGWGRCLSRGLMKGLLCLQALPQGSAGPGGTGAPSTQWPE